MRLRATGLSAIARPDRRARAWTPAQLAPAMWLDAADASTIVLNGSTVSQWSDKSGNGRHAVQATAANQPAWGRGRNLLLWSEDLTHSAWVKRGTCVVTPNDAIAPDGTLTADRVSGLSPSGLNDFYNADYYTTTRGTAGAAYTPTVYLKRISTSGIVSVQNPINGITNGRWDIDLSQLPDAWVRITATTPGVTVNNPFTLDSSGRGGFLLNCTTGGPVAVHVWGTQLNPETTPDTYQRTEATAFTVATGLSERPSVTFAGASANWMSTGNLHVAMQNDYTVLAVMSTTNTVTSSLWYTTPGLLGGERGGVGSDHGIGFNGLTPVTGVGGAGDVMLQAATPLTSGSPALVQWDRANSTGVSNWFLNGAANGSGTGPTGSRTYNNAMALGSMWEAGGGQWLSARVGEMVVVPSVLSAEDRQRLEGYLAWKWGLCSSLPESHPYKYDGTIFGFGKDIWTPARLTTSLWLDAADASTLTLNGSTVSQWADKSGNSRHATQATAANQPTYATAGWNGRPTLQFDGSGDGFSLPSGLSAPRDIYVVDQGQGYLFAGADQRIAFYAASGVNSVSWANPPNILVGTDPWRTPDTMQIEEFAMNATGGYAVRHNGVTRYPGQAASGPNTLDRIGLKWDTLSGIVSWTGRVSEIVVLPSVASVADRQLLEGYLAWKWSGLL